MLHWVTALGVFGLFALGWWMVDLGYYDPWYRDAPELHKGIGVLLFALVLVRLVWRVQSSGPKPLASHTRLIRSLALVTKGTLYALLIGVSLSGYLITTAKGDELRVFDLFGIPALVTGIDNLEDIAGDFHWWMALVLLGLAALHAIAALKHHLLDRDDTLKRMTLGSTTANNQS